VRPATTRSRSAAPRAPVTAAAGDDSRRCRPWHDRTMTAQVQKTDEQWRQELSPEEYAVLRQAATEPAWTGPLLDEKRVGVYRCRACGAELFRSETKFESH